jgi:hypothetical protein
VLADWADQPEASFLLKRARESTPNRNTLAIAIVDHEPTAAEMRDNRLDFLIYRPIAAEEADAVLAKACEQMQPSSAEDAAESSREDDDASSVSVGAEVQEHSQQDPPARLPEASAAEATDDDEVAPTNAQSFDRTQPCARVSAKSVLQSSCSQRRFACGGRATLFSTCRARRRKIPRVLRESVAALFYHEPNRERCP